MNLILSVLLIMSWPEIGMTEQTDRADIDPKYKWTLDDIYTSWEDWERDLGRLEILIGEIASLKGSLSEGPANLLKAFKLGDELGMLIDSVYSYPAMTRDLDNRNNERYAKVQQVLVQWSQYQQATAWMNPELLTIPWETMEKWLESKELAPYRYGVEDLYRQQAHVLDEEGERLLSYFSQFGSNPNSVHNQLTTADIEFRTITLSDGEEVTVTPGAYSNIISTNRNQEDRKNAFLARNGVYAANENTYAEIYNGICQKDWAYAQARNYGSTLEASLEGDNVPIEVYENLVETVRAGTDPIKKYHALRKKALGLEEYHLYDTAIPVVEIDENYEYADVKDDVIASAKPLGKEYMKNLKTAFTPGWVDVYETPGKTTGAYSGGVYGVHPFMLLNYSNTLSDVFTLAHEMGHTVHTMLANQYQPYATSNYTLFVAEVASTMHEAFFLEHMLAKSKSPEERLVLLSHAINNIEGTFFAQSMFADFELQAHRLVETGQPITADVLNKLYRDLNRAYYGEGVIYDDLYDITWARIGHFFFYPYYVYQYATCFASSASLYNDITDGNILSRRKAVNRYLDLLKSGGNNYPMEQLKLAGVDLTQPEAVQATLDQMSMLVDRFENELKALKLID
jgi:oligoendopeptidase F